MPTNYKEKKVNCDHKEARKIVFNIHEHCATCRRFSATPTKPVVSLPVASEFGEIMRLRAMKRKNLGMPNYNNKTGYPSTSLPSHLS